MYRHIYIDTLADAFLPKLHCIQGMYTQLTKKAFPLSYENAISECSRCPFLKRFRNVKMFHQGNVTFECSLNFLEQVATVKKCLMNFQLKCFRIKTMYNVSVLSF